MGLFSTFLNWHPNRFSENPFSPKRPDEMMNGWEMILMFITKCPKIPFHSAGKIIGEMDFADFQFSRMKLRYFDRVMKCGKLILKDFAIWSGYGRTIQGKQKYETKSYFRTLLENLLWSMKVAILKFSFVQVERPLLLSNKWLITMGTKTKSKNHEWLTKKEMRKLCANSSVNKKGNDMMNERLNETERAKKRCRN